MKLFPFLTFVCLIFSACAKEKIEANGNTITEVRSLNSFSGLVLSGSKNIHIQYGTECKVELRGSSNLIPYYKTRVDGHTLRLGYENRLQIRNDDIEVRVTLPKIQQVDISGSGSISVAGNFPTLDLFEARISGSGDVNVHDAIAVERVIADISGSGKANLESLKAQTAEVNISGSGEVRLNVKEELKVRISGSGKVYYYGNANVNAQISGSGKVIRETL